METERLKNDYADWLLESYDMDLVLELAREQIMRNLDELTEDELYKEIAEYTDLLDD